MNLGEIRGVVVAGSRVAELVERRLVLIQPLDEEKRPTGRRLVAADPFVSAGEGAVVWYVSGSDATDALGERFQPVDAAVVGLVASIRRWDGS